jgi:hypothetical protein
MSALADHVAAEPGGEDNTLDGSASKQARSRFAGTWARDSDTGFRELLVWMGVPWILSFVIARKQMEFNVSFEDGDPDRKLHLKANSEHAEIIPTDGTTVEVEVTQPFTRMVICSMKWIDDNTMQMVRLDEKTNSLKKHPSKTTVTRRLIDDNTIESTLNIEKLNDHTEKSAILIIKRK